MLRVLRSVFNVLLLIQNFLVSTVIAFLNVSYVVGFYIVKCITYALAIVCSTLSSTSSVIKLLHDDFCVFLVDLAQKFEDASLFTASLLVDCILLVKDCLVYLKQVVFNLCTSVLGTFSFVFYGTAQLMGLVVEGAEIFKKCIISVGRGFWLALKLIPICLLEAVDFIIENVICLTKTAFSQVQELSIHVSDKVSSVAKWALSYFFNFPLEALIGLIFGTVLCWTLVRYHKAIQRGVCLVARKAVWHAHTLCLCIPVTLYRVLAVINRRTRSVVNREAQGEEPHVQVRRSARLQAKHSPGQVNDNSDVLRKQLAKEMEEKLCIVCQDQHKNVIVMPCRHLCLCFDCSQIITATAGRCPICREFIQRTLNVFL